MIFIGEKINGSIPSVQKAIIARDRAFIEALVAAQSDAGADYIDVNAGTDPSRECEDMLWLLQIVSECCETKITVDSSSPKTIERALAEFDHIAMVNSINADPKRLASFLPLVASSGSEVIALCMDESSSAMPKDCAQRLELLDKILEQSRGAGIPDEKLYIDPLIMAVGTDTNAGLLAFECIRAIREACPSAHITGGLSNISYGMPKRALLNRTFLTLAIYNGMDSAIVNPCDSDFIAALKATELLLGKDMFCRKYTTAARNGFARK